MGQLVDLSMLVNEQTVVFPGDALPRFEPVGSLATTKFVDHVLHINNHLGTHIDAPGHMVAGGKLLPDYGPERFVTEGICIDARGADRLGAELLRDVEVAPGMSVLFYTGRGDVYTDQAYATDYPPTELALAEALVEKRVGMVGIDMISYDHDEPFPIHNALLRHDILLLENLVNLGQVVGKRFKLYALPIHFQLEAAPARVMAELP